MASYGVVPPEEFDAAREALEPVDEEVYRTFREDYEFSGAETGEVTAFYGGECSSCGLSAELRATKRFWSGDETVNE
jgi:hypothetical protein